MDTPPPSYEEVTGALEQNSYLKSLLPTALPPPRYDEITTAEPDTLSIRLQPISSNIQLDNLTSYPLTTSRPQTNMVLNREQNKECDEKLIWYLAILAIIALGIFYIYLPYKTYRT